MRDRYRHYIIYAISGDNHVISIVALVVIALVLGAILGSAVGHMVAGGIIALVLFLPQTQELRDVIATGYEKLAPEITKAATNAIIGDVPVPSAPVSEPQSVPAVDPPEEIIELEPISDSESRDDEVEIF